MTEPSDSRPIPIVAFGLAALWLLIPALQYAGAFERTAAVVERRPPAGALAFLDLTSWYLGLFVLTALYACFRRLRAESQDREQ